MVRKGRLHVVERKCNGGVGQYYVRGTSDPILTTYSTGVKPRAVQHGCERRGGQRGQILPPEDISERVLRLSPPCLRIEPVVAIVATAAGSLCDAAAIVGIVFPPVSFQVHRYEGDEYPGQEGQAPSPSDELLVGEHRAYEHSHERTQQRADVGCVAETHTARE